MDKRQQLSIGYFLLALAVLFGLQTFFTAARDENISYSQFKALAKRGAVSNVVIGDKAIRGEIKPEGVKEVIPPDRLKQLSDDIKYGKKRSEERRVGKECRS